LLFLSLDQTLFLPCANCDLRYRRQRWAISV